VPVLFPHRAKKCWRPRCKEVAEVAVGPLLLGQRPADMAIRGGAGTFAEGTAPTVECQTERGRWAVSSPHAYRPSHSASQDLFNVLAYSSRDRVPWWLRLCTGS